jgi:L-asparaginase
VQAWVTAGVRGLVVAATGSGTVHAELEAALDAAAQAGVLVRRASRVARGGAIDRAGDHYPAAGTLTPAQARVELLLQLVTGP